MHFAAARRRRADWLPFAFLDGYQFTLSRQRESRAMGALGIDGVGGQRMLMLGVRQQKYGCPRPDGTRRGRVEVANSSGDLDAHAPLLGARNHSSNELSSPMSAS